MSTFFAIVNWRLNFFIKLTYLNLYTQIGEYYPPRIVCVPNRACCMWISTECLQEILLLLLLFLDNPILEELLPRHKTQTLNNLAVTIPLS